MTNLHVYENYLSFLPDQCRCCYYYVYAVYDRYIAGALSLYDKRFDRVNTRSDKKLMRMNKTIHTVTTTDDPIIRKVISLLFVCS